MKNDGKCGICGDPLKSPEPRPNEAGGIYGQGVIGRTYYLDKGFIDVRIEVLSSVQGFFQFNLCPNNDVSERITEDCLDEYPLNIFNKDQSRVYGRRYYPEISPGRRGTVSLSLEIPEGLTCEQCVLRWRWRGGKCIRGVAYSYCPASQE